MVRNGHVLVQFEEIVFGTILCTFESQTFLPRDATQSAIMPQYVVCLSVCLSATFMYRNHIGWHTSRIITQSNRLRYLLRLTPKSAICSNGNTSKIGWNRG